MNKRAYNTPATDTFILPEKELMDFPLTPTGSHAPAPERVMLEPE